VMIVVNANWFLRQVKKFQPSARSAPQNVPKVLN
jgi:hypothetical protein